jgi:hypothetical protein
MNTYFHTDEMKSQPSKPTIWMANYLKVGTTVVVHGQRFSCTLALIVTAPDTDGIDIAPVSLHLGVLEGITIDLAGAGEEEPGVDPLCQSEHVQSPNHIGLVPSQMLRLTQIISRKKLQTKTLDQSPF